MLTERELGIVDDPDLAEANDTEETAVTAVQRVKA